MDFQKIPLDLVKPSPMNPRKTFDEEAINELADNIDKQGLIQPITVRTDPHGEGFEIVCGERRYRAFCLLKGKEDEINVAQTAAHRKKYDRYQSIPAIIREMSDEEAFEAMITENLQRQDVDPMEEAFAFGQLIKNGKTSEEVAIKFGKSIRFVQDRCKLNSLIPELMVAVKEDKMSIAAAMIICKLDDDMQKKYHSQYSENYQGLTKTTAESFVNALFMYLSKAPWYKSDNQADEDFEGGCNCKCAECQFNTANHGCLFWEMKSQDSGRCTDRIKFRSKLLAYMVKMLDEKADMLVKAGQPLQQGKMVVGIDLSEYTSETTKSIKAAFKAEVESRGFEVVNPAKYFKRKCWYDAEDGRTIEKLAAGEVYKVLAVEGSGIPQLEESFYYVKEDTQTVSGEDEASVKVKGLLREYSNLNTFLPAEYTLSGCKVLGERGVDSVDRELDDVERTLLYLLIVKNNRELCRELGLGESPSDDEITKYISEHPEKSNHILREYIRHALRFGSTIVTLNEARKLAEPYINSLGALWCPDEYNKARDKVREKYDKSVKKIAGQLKKLGYDLDGNRLSEKPKDSVPTMAPPALEWISIN